MNLPKVYSEDDAELALTRIQARINVVTKIDLGTPIADIKDLLLSLPEIKKVFFEYLKASKEGTSHLTEKFEILAIYARALHHYTAMKISELAYIPPSENTDLNSLVLEIREQIQAVANGVTEVERGYQALLDKYTAGLKNAVYKEIARQKDKK